MSKDASTNLLAAILDAEASRDYEQASLLSLEMADSMVYSDPAISQLFLGKALVYATLARIRRRRTT